MRILFSIICFSLLANSVIAGPQSARKPVAGTYAAGLMVGTLGSVSGKYWVTDRGAIDVGIEFLGGHPGAVIYSDFYWQVPMSESLGKETKFFRESSLYFGAGLGFGFWARAENCGRWHCAWDADTEGTGNGSFYRALVGLEWYPVQVKYSYFAELGSSKMLYPTRGHATDIAIGIRYYF